MKKLHVRAFNQSGKFVGTLSDLLFNKRLLREWQNQDNNLKSAINAIKLSLDPRNDRTRTLQLMKKAYLNKDGLLVVDEEKHFDVLQLICIPENKLEN